MYRIAIMYPAGEGKRFDVDYYVTRHVPMVKALLGEYQLKSAEVDVGVAGGGGAPPPYVVIGQMVFDDVEDFRRGMAKHGAQINGDLPNFTDIRPVVQISRMHRS
jgi:uncharacterized protein (TIGR02118 family)